MKRFCLVGRDISYSLSPEVHSAIMAETGVEGSYIIEDIADFSLIGGIIERYDGFNVTKPYKKDAQRLTGAGFPVNTVVKTADGVEGYNTDIAGFFYPLERAGVRINGMKTLILGSGGAADAIAGALKARGAEVWICARNAGAAGEIAGKYGCALYRGDAPQAVVNATTFGYNAGENPMPQDLNTSELEILYDLIYNPPKTDFLESFRGKDVLRVNGRGMLTAQAIFAQGFFWRSELTYDRISDIYIAVMKKVFGESV